MRSLRRSLRGSAGDCPSAAPSSIRMAAACGPSTTLRAAQAFSSPYPPRARHSRAETVGRLGNRAPSRHRLRHGSRVVVEVGPQPPLALLQGHRLAPRVVLDLVAANLVDSE